jgi:hypothetical protein
MTPGDQPNTPAISTYQCDVNRVVWNQIWCCFEPTRDGLFTCAKQLQLNSYQFCLFILQFKDPTSQTTKRTLLKRWVSLPNKDSSNIPAPAPSSIVHLSSLYSVSHALPPLDTHNLLWILSSIWQSTSLHWLPLHVRRVGCVLLNNSIQSRPNSLNICQNDCSHKFWWRNTMQSTPQGPPNISSVTISTGHAI